MEDPNKNGHRSDDLNETNYLIDLIQQNSRSSNSNSKYTNLGLSHNSQELIGDFYNALNNDDMTSRAKSFEEIVYSVVEDIQTFKRETERLEMSMRSEKEKNEEVLKHMIEEADQQLAKSIESLNQERKKERDQFEKAIDNLKESLSLEIYNLQDNIEKMSRNEEQHFIERSMENQKLVELEQEIRNLNRENFNLKKQLNDAESQTNALKNKLISLEQEMLNENEFKQDSADESIKEINSLRNEISILSQENKKLVDKNDSLAEEIEKIKRITDGSGEQNKDIQQQLNFSIDSDEDVDSGYQNEKIAVNTNSNNNDNENSKPASSVATDSDEEDSSSSSSRRSSPDELLAVSTANIDRLKADVKCLNRENQSLRNLYLDCQNSNRTLHRQMDEMKKLIVDCKPDEPTSTLSTTPKTIKEQVPPQTNSLHNAYKKLNDLNDLLRDEIEKIKLKASEIAVKENNSVPFNNMSRH